MYKNEEKLLSEETDHTERKSNPCMGLEAKHPVRNPVPTPPLTNHNLFTNKLQQSQTNLFQSKEQACSESFQQEEEEGDYTPGCTLQSKKQAPIFKKQDLVPPRLVLEE